MPDPNRIADPNVRALTNQLVDMQERLDRMERGLRATQLGNSSIENGYLLVNDGSGVPRTRIGRQPDGKFGWGAVNSDPPPTPNTAELVGTSAGFNILWNGAFDGIKPSDFTYVVAYASPAGAGFIEDDSLIVGRFLGAGVLPVTAINGQALNPELGYWVRLVAYNSGGVASPPSMTAGPVSPQPVVATELLDGIVENVHLALDAVEAANIAAGAVGDTEITDDAVHTRHVIARAIDTVRIAVETIQAENMATDSVDARIIRALSIVSDHIDVNSVNAGHIQAGAVSADKLAAVLILASKIIAGDPDGWRLELGDSQTPILYWDGAETGFAVSRDAVTGQSNVYLSGRVEFGNGSMIESDYVDLAEQPASGFQAPKPRQQRTWIDSGPKTSVTAQWTSATQRGSLCLMAVFQTAVTGSTPPNCGTPAGASIVWSQTSGAHRLTLFQVPNSPTSRTAETFGSSAGAARWAIALTEYTGMAAAAFDVQAVATGTGALASAGTTTATTQAAELQFAVYGSPTVGFSNGKGGQWTSPTNGFMKILEGDGTGGQGIAVATKNATLTGPASTDITINKSVPWIGIIATFKAAPAAGVPPVPRAGTLRVFARSRAGYPTPHVIDSTGATYPVGRVPYCRVYLTADFALVGVTDVYAQSQWAVGLDPYAMAAISTSGGTFSNITIPVTGNYLVDYKALYPNATSSAQLACFVTKNTRAVGASIARDIRNGAVPAPSTDGSPVLAHRPVPLAAGDVLYWGNWSSVNTSVLAGKNNIPTEITVHYLGPS